MSKILLGLALLFSISMSGCAWYKGVLAADKAHNEFCRKNTDAKECRGWEDPEAYSDTSGD